MCVCVCVCVCLCVGVTIKDIMFSGIEGTQRGGLAGQIYCSDTVPCTHIKMENISITPFGGLGAENRFQCWRAFGEATSVSPPSCLIPD